MKSWAYILLFVFVFISIGTSVVFFLALHHIRTSMEESLLKDKKIINISFTKEEYAELHWTKAKKEFRFRGKMYDIISVEKNWNTVNIRCDFDKKETLLRKKIKVI